MLAERAHTADFNSSLDVASTGTFAEKSAVLSKGSTLDRS